MNLKIKYFLFFFLFVMNAKAVVIGSIRTNIKNTTKSTFAFSKDSIPQKTLSLDSVGYGIIIYNEKRNELIVTKSDLSGNKVTKLLKSIDYGKTWKEFYSFPDIKKLNPENRLQFGLVIPNYVNDTIFTNLYKVRVKKKY